MDRAKVFISGHSQAIRLPKQFRFSSEVKEVEIQRLGEGFVVLPVNLTWKEIFNKIVPTGDFLEHREDLPPQEREFFE